jgi:hypothetical protein
MVGCPMFGIRRAACKGRAAGLITSFTLKKAVPVKDSGQLFLPRELVLGPGRIFWFLLPGTGSFACE